MQLPGIRQSSVLSNSPYRVSREVCITRRMWHHSSFLFSSLSLHFSCVWRWESMEEIREFVCCVLCWASFLVLLAAVVLAGCGICGQLKAVAS